MTQLVKSREASSSAIWKQIATVVALYVQQTDSRRMHLAELRSRDAESAAEITENEERIRREEELIKHLTTQHDHLVASREQQMKALESELSDVNLHFLKVKKNLQRDLQIDEKKLVVLSDASNQSLRYLEKLANKGEQIKNLAVTCTKLQTHRENSARWLPLSAASELIKIGEDDEDDTKEEQTVRTDSGKLQGVTRPKTAFTGRQGIGEPSPTDTQSITTVVLQTKGLKSSTASSSSSSHSKASASPGIIARCVESMRGMENFWFAFNKVEVDYLEMKEEKKVLERDNKQLRGMIRAVLETAALAPTIPHSKVSTRVSSKRVACSAPLRRTVFS